MWRGILHVFFGFTASSTSPSPGQTRDASDFPNAGPETPIFIRRLQCPDASDSDQSEAPYTACLNEVVLGLSECTHSEDIGIFCEGTYVLPYSRKLSQIGNFTGKTLMNC